MLLLQSVLPLGSSYAHLNWYTQWVTRQEHQSGPRLSSSQPSSQLRILRMSGQVPRRTTSGLLSPHQSRSLPGKNEQVLQTQQNADRRLDEMACLLAAVGQLVPRKLCTSRLQLRISKKTTELAVPSELIAHRLSNLGLPVYRLRCEN